MLYDMAIQYSIISYKLIIHLGRCLTATERPESTLLRAWDRKIIITFK